MAYTIITFNARDAWHRDIYSFRVNMVTHELSVEYSNNTGGRTMNGVVLNEKQYNHIKRLTSPLMFEKYRDGAWKKNTEWLLDPNDWNVRFISDDGTPMLTMESNLESYSAPPALVALVEYIMHIGAFENMGHRLF